uniref:Taxilin alpha n=1 Tax=Dicentrarchus labrax TaxID=13489 RepID=A0A8P4GPV2_DICLA
MKKQDTEESVSQGSEDAPPAAGETEQPAAAKDSSDGNSPKESEPQTPQTDTPQTDTPQTDTPQTETPQTETPQTDTPQTETPQTDTPPQSDEAGIAEAPLSQCDMAEELSRQLEDILSTYCRESMSDDASSLPNGQSHSLELNGLTRELDKPAEGKVNGANNGVEKEQKKTQDKKKVKGLGKEITLLMQTLNTLSTPEEKLAGLCKKYAELLEEHRNTQKQMRVLQKKQNQLVQEKDNLRNEHSKAILARSKLESLCRELQRHNRTLKEEGMQRTRLEEEKRKEVTSHFQVTLNDIQAQMEQHNERNASLRQENTELAEKLKKLYEQYKLREEHIDKVVKHKDLQQQLVDAKLHQAQELLKESEERHDREKEFLLKEAVESQRMCELMKQQEVHLKQQLSLYTEKFEEFQTTLSKSNEVFTTFKQEMEKMTKKIKKLEKETAMYRSRWESSNKALLEMAEEKSVRDHDFEALQGKVQRLEKLRRALKVERNELNKKVQNLSDPHSGTAGAPTSDPGTDSPSPPPTDSLLEPSSHPVPDMTPCSQSCHCDPELDTDSLLEGAKAQPIAAQE